MLWNIFPYKATISIIIITMLCGCTDTNNDNNENEPTKILTDNFYFTIDFRLQDEHDDLNNSYIIIPEVLQNNTSILIKSSDFLINGTYKNDKYNFENTTTPFGNGITIDVKNLMFRKHWLIFLLIYIVSTND